MKYLAALQQKKLFTLSDAERLTGNLMTAKAMLQSYKKAGYIVSIRRNLYAAVDLASGEVLANRYEIGSSINQSSFISHHAALEFHGVANQVFYTVTVSSAERFTDFEFDGITYMQYAPKTMRGVVVPSMMPLVSVTDIDRTVIDCLYDIPRAGGLEELLEALRLIPALHEDALLNYLKEYDQIYLWQKAGFILQHFAADFNLSTQFFEICKSNIHERKKQLTDFGETVYYPEWKLYAPKDLLSILNDGGDTLV